MNSQRGYYDLFFYILWIFIVKCVKTIEFDSMVSQAKFQFASNWAQQTKPFKKYGIDLNTYFVICVGQCNGLMVRFIWIGIRIVALNFVFNAGTLKSM